MTERIDYVAKAHEILDAVQNLMERPSEGYQAAQHVQNLALSSIAGAQVHATLALVEQQRIANLITLGEQWQDTGYPNADSMCPEFKPEIQAALGIE